MTLSLELGSSHIKVYSKTEGVLLYEPTIVVAKIKNNKPTLVSFGKSAYEMSETLEDDEKLIQPIKNGVIVDFCSAKILLDGVIDAVIGDAKTRKELEIVFCVPSCATKSQIDDYVKLLNSCGISEIVLKPQLTCVANLLDTDPNRPYLIVDIGAGKTEIGLTTTKTLIDAISLTLSGEFIDLSIHEILKSKFNISVQRAEIERLKEEIGSLYSTDATTINVSAESLSDYAWNNYLISSQDIYDALVLCYDKIFEGINIFIKSLDEKHQKSIAETGIFFSGLGCEISGFEKYAQSKLNKNIYILDSPSTSVVEGALN